MRLPTLLALLAAAAFALGVSPAVRAAPVEIPEAGGTVLQARLFLPPPGVPAAPAIVALHGCGGAYPTRDREWIEVLTKAGHAMLFPDSFGSHGLGPQCRVSHRIAGYMAMRRADALAAASWLERQAGIPPGGIILMGWSNGASTVLRASRPAHDLPAGLFRGFVAFYPACRFASPGRDWHPVAPMLILIGAKDDWTPAPPCHELTLHAPADVTLLTYPGAYHDFDVPVPVRILRHVSFAQNPDGSVHVGGNPPARADAMIRVPAFMAHLAASSP